MIRERGKIKPNIWQRTQNSAAQLCRPKLRVVLCSSRGLPHVAKHDFQSLWRRLRWTRSDLSDKNHRLADRGQTKPFFHLLPWPPKAILALGASSCTPESTVQAARLRNSILMFFRKRSFQLFGNRPARSRDSKGQKKAEAGAAPDSPGMLAADSLQSP